MPKDITHWVLAAKIFKRLDQNSSLKGLIERYQNVYLAGAVILDTPFYLIYGKDGKRMNRSAEKIHDSPGNSYAVLENALKFYGRHVPDVVLVLILGILTHIHIDALFHPFVYYFSGVAGKDPKRRKQSQYRHHTLETYLDIYFLKEISLHNRALFSETLKHLEMEVKNLVEFLSSLYSWEEKIDAALVRKTLRTNAVFQRWFAKNSPRIFLTLLNQIPGVDLTHFISYFYPHLRPEPARLFQRPYDYRHPVSGEKVRHTIRELSEESLRVVTNVFRAVEHHLKQNSLADIFIQRTGPNLYTGMAGHQKKDMHFFKTDIDVFHLIYQPEGYE